MKVVCKANNLSGIAGSAVQERLRKYISMPEGEVDLELGKEYRVYGVVFWDNCPWFYLCSDKFDEYPKPFASDFFDVVDSRLSVCWRISHSRFDEGEPVTLLVFDEWSSDESFYERLVDGDSDAVALFARYRDLMDNE